MTPDEILDDCLETLEGTILVSSWGERGIFYNPGRKLKRGVYVLTVKEKDGENDRSSHLDREGVYRINLGLRQETFRRLFGPPPPRPPKGGTVEMPVDFSQLDILLPHPVYAWMGWICALNPSRRTFEELRPLIQESYQYAKEKYTKRIK